MVWMILYLFLVHLPSVDSAAATPIQSVQPVVPEPATPLGEAELERSGTSATLPDQEEGDRLLPTQKKQHGTNSTFRR